MGERSLVGQCVDMLQFGRCFGGKVERVTADYHANDSSATAPTARSLPNEAHL